MDLRVVRTEKLRAFPSPEDGLRSLVDRAPQAEEFAGRALIWALHRASLARNFDRVLAMSGGKLQEQGRYDELDHKGSLTSLLIAAAGIAWTIQRAL